ncbi:MAG: transporter substrate-binding domain-containing protein [Candidatus Hydrogenedentes bacterium]|nr:transporter substrate-binding domain-containing protein [Candidatus Hydrogenedentota bacterium]
MGMASERDSFRERALARRAGALLLALLVAFGTWAAGAHEGPAPPVQLTTEERAWLDQNPEKLTLFFNTEFPPIKFQGRSGAFAGMGADIIAMVEERLGVTFLKEPCEDWNRHLAALRSGECAIAPTIVRTPERVQYAFFTEPYATVPVVIITTSAVQENLTLEELAGRRVAVVSGFATENYVRERARERFAVVAVEDVPDGLQRVAFGQVDALVENLAVAAYYIDQEGIPNLRVAGSTDYAFAWSIGVSREYPLLFSAIRKALEAIPADEIDVVRRRWIPLEIPTGLAPETARRLAVIAAFVLALVVSLAVITYFLKRRLNEKVEGLRAAQQELLEQSERVASSERQFRAIFEHAPYAVVITSLDGERFIDANNVFLANHGLTREELRDLRPAEVLELSQEQQAKTVETLTKAGALQDVEATVPGRDGTQRHILFSSVLLDIQGEKQALSMTVDVTERKEAEDALRQREETFRALSENSEDVIMRFDRELRHTYVNPSVEGPTGIPPEQFIGKTHEELGFPEDLCTLWKETLREVFSTGNARRIEFELPSGIWVDWLVMPEFGKQGEVEAVITSARDITERKEAEEERERLQQQLLRAQRMESVGRLAGGVAHDFNNMLAVILGQVELALEQVDPSEPLFSYLKEVHEAARRSAELTRQLLAFARRQTVAPKVLDLNQTVEGMLNMLRRLVGEDIDVNWLPAPGLWPIKMDPTQLDQILANLCVNARDAIDGVGTVTIETGTASFDEAYCAGHAGCLPGDYVLLGVSDDGCGMDAETLEHVFEPFFTTKGVGAGTGLGLATVYGIVRQNDGFIDLQSELGKSTTCKIYLPRSGGEPAPSAAEEADEAPVGRGETVVIVEDEPAILEIGRRALERFGYAVLTASTPGEALRLAEEHAGDIRLFITDVVMPEMNGRELADRIHEVRPEARFIFMSGYTPDVIVHRGVLDDGTNFIQKPFTISDLAIRARQVLDRE